MNNRTNDLSYNKVNAITKLSSWYIFLKSNNLWVWRQTTQNIKSSRNTTDTENLVVVTFGVWYPSFIYSLTSRDQTAIHASLSAYWSHDACFWLTASSVRLAASTMLRSHHVMHRIFKPQPCTWDNPSVIAFGFDHLLYVLPDTNP